MLLLIIFTILIVLFTACMIWAEIRTSGIWLVKDTNEYTCFIGNYTEAMKYMLEDEGCKYMEKFEDKRKIFRSE